MKLTIDEKICLKHKLTVEEALFALAFRMLKKRDVLSNMMAREILVDVGGQMQVTQHWSDVLDEILADSEGSVDRTDEELIELAIKVKDCFPQTKMRDRYGRETPYYFRCNKSEVAKALKRFFTAFGNDYSDDEIVEATKRYVASFKGNYAGMRLAKYFIMKNPVKQNADGEGYVDQVSDLLTYLDNKESGEIEEVNTEDFTSKLI